LPRRATTFNARAWAEDQEIFQEFDQRTGSVQIELAKTVAAQPETVFAIVADATDWPRIIRSIKSIEVLTPGPIRAGTRLRAVRVMLGRDGTQDLEVAKIERLRHPDLQYELDHVIDAVYGGGCRMILILRSSPSTPAGRTLQPVMIPFMDITLRDELEQDLSDLASAVARPGQSRRRSLR
jgi:hypothetical protein